MEGVKNRIDMAQIPYIEHKKRLYKFYKKVNRLRVALITTNIAWAIALSVLVVLLVAR